MTITREQALLLLEAMPHEQVMDKPCHLCNWRLWFAWCQVKEREPDPSDIWTERNVVESCKLLLIGYFKNLLEGECQPMN